MKHASIIDVVTQLRARLGEHTFEVEDHWEADQCAIGVVSPHYAGRLAYICTFGKAPGRYDLLLELPSSGVDEPPYAPAGSANDIDFDALASSIARHFAGDHLDLRANER
jgi:hypothetical protein